MLFKPLLFLFSVCISFANGFTSSTEYEPTVSEHTSSTAFGPMNNFERFYMVNHGCRGTPNCETTEETCKYNKWGKWSECSGSCSPLAERFRNRTCLTDTCSTGICTFGSSTEVERCRYLPCCKGFPKWTKWGEWEEPCKCRVTSRRRYRTCSFCKDKRCNGPSYEDEICPDPCPPKCIKKSKWLHWESWNSCKPKQVKAGTCIKSRQRTCSTKDCLDGSPCLGISKETTRYQLHGCSVYSIWPDWSDWSTCNSASCNMLSNRTRTRRCHHKEKICADGTRCDWQTKEIFPCLTSCCEAGKPSWSVWSRWSICKQQCGIGTQTRSRKCEGSKECLAHSFCLGEWREKRICFKPCCGQVKLGQWSEWSACNKSCGGVSERKRKCKARKCRLEKEHCATLKIEKRPCPKCS